MQIGVCSAEVGSTDNSEEAGEADEGPCKPGPARDIVDYFNEDEATKERADGDGDDRLNPVVVEGIIDGEVRSCRVSPARCEGYGAGILRMLGGPNLSNDAGVVDSKAID